MSHSQHDTIPRKMVKWLFREQQVLCLNAMEWCTLLLATVVINHTKFSLEFFNELADRIKNSSVDSNLTDLKKDFILYNSLSFIAFADPKDGQKISIKNTDYVIERIALTSDWVSSSYFAYGLKSEDISKPSYLIFQGTTTPADNGFLAGILADTCPFGAIGAQLYTRGQEKIQNWITLEKSRTGQNVICTGQSLGGALSMHAYIHQPDSIDFFVINPPSLTQREKKIFEEKIKTCLFSFENKILTVVSHVNDPVIDLGSGYFPPGTFIYRHGDKHENPLIAHAKAPDCSIDAKDIDPQKYDGHHSKKPYLWKFIKPFLYVIVLVMHLIAWPFRICIKLMEMLTLLNLEPNDRPTSSRPSHLG